MRATVFVAEAMPDLAAGHRSDDRARGGSHDPAHRQGEAEEPEGEHDRAGLRLPEGRQCEHHGEADRPTATTLESPSRSRALLDEPAPIISPSASGLMIAPASIAL